MLAWLQIVSYQPNLLFDSNDLATFDVITWLDDDIEKYLIVSLTMKAFYPL